MIAILKFNLDKHEDCVAHLQCIKGADMVFALWEFSQALNRICDESEDGKHIDEEVVRKAFFDILEEKDIILDKLIY
jgi:hypothetical protein